MGAAARAEARADVAGDAHGSSPSSLAARLWLIAEETAEDSESACTEPFSEAWSSLSSESALE